MCAFIALGLVLSVRSQEIGLGNVSEMTCFVEQDVKPLLNQSSHAVYLNELKPLIIHSSFTSQMVWQ